MKKYLVTGGAGLIGSYLCESLIENGHFVYCVDNLIYGNIKNIEHLMNSNRFRLSSELNPEEYEGIAGIFHLASPVTSKLCMENPQNAFETNIRMAWELTLMSKRKNIPILLASTVKAKEESGDIYILYKRVSENIVMAFGRGKVARLGNVYGPKMRRDDPRVIPTFLRMAPRFVIYGNGLQQDSFCWVEDVVKCLKKFMDSNYFGTLEIGHPEPITIKALASLICKLKFGHLTTPNIEFVEDSGSINHNKIPDISLTTKILEWVPEVKLKDGLRRMIESYSGGLP